MLLLHGAGFTFGYLAARAAGFPAPVNRTVAIEVGMQNSGLAVVLARLHFAASPLAAMPGAISAIVHCLIGSAVAAVWRSRPIR